MMFFTLLAEAGWSEGWRLMLEAIVAIVSICIIPWAKSVHDNLKTAAEQAAKAASQSEHLGNTLSSALHDNREEHRHFFDKINDHASEIASINERIPAKRRRGQ